jgi:hypothetical protein
MATHLPVDIEQDMKRRWNRALAKQINMMMAFRRDRDPRLVGLMRRIPPPPELVQAIIKLSAMIKMAESEAWKTQLIIWRAELYRILDMFQPTPIPVETIGMKSEATEQGEIDIMPMPEGFGTD